MNLVDRMNRFEARLHRENLELRKSRVEVLQINLGKVCNLTCNHCHVNAGPARTENMTRPTLDRILDWLEKTDIPTVDLTGGAPEMNPHFRYGIERIKRMAPARHVIDRCNLTILLEPGYQGLAEFLAEHRTEIIASMPCYSPENVNAQRGEGVFDESIKALQMLNCLGYGMDAALPLHLVYNPVGGKLPGPQAELEADYKRELRKHFGIVFGRLYTITNMPIARFASYLRRQGEHKTYLERLRSAFNPSTVSELMCRTTLNVDWQGRVYDCDFNQMLNLGPRNGTPLFLWEMDLSGLENHSIATGDHCFGCTAGAGSSCGGALLEN